MKHQKVTFLALAVWLLSTPIFAQIDADAPSRLKDQQILDDLIVDGSACIGFDCVNGESFGFKTLRLKENNLRIHFDDTSTSASFPSSDWCIQINDTSNGGDNYYGVVHENTGRRIFTLEANAPSHSLYVDDGGRVGFGTSTPVADLHVKTGNTPTLRLEQDGSSGFTPQTWDVAGNEANFFLRDATSGSTLPFRVFPGAPSNALTIEGTTGDVGLGTTSPDSELHIRRTDAANTTMNLENVNGAAQTVRIKLKHTGQEWDFTNNKAAGQIRFLDVTGGGGGANVAFQVDPASSGTPFKAVFLGDVDGVSFNPTSDIRLKKDVRNYDEGLSIISQLSPIKYKFNGKAGIRSTKEYYSINAQELQKVAPHLVGTSLRTEEDSEGNVKSSTEYLNYDLAGVVWTLVNAVNEQQTDIVEKDDRIATLEAQVVELNNLKKNIETLTEQVNQLSKMLAIDNSQNVHIRNNKVAQLGQNYPNPYSTETTIDYFLSPDASVAVIQFFDVSGKVLKQVPIKQTGKGQINLKTSDLPLGQYTYSLVVDNQIIDTKQMIIAR